jgi:hypothetical protein
MEGSIELLPQEKLKSSTKGKHLKKGSGRPLPYNPVFEEEELV